jgi:hypothetical protein
MHILEKHMSTFKPTGAYYRVTWNLTSPTDYTGSNNTAGGINPYTSRQYHSMIALTGTADLSGGWPGAASDVININGYDIGPIGSGTSLTNLIQLINNMTPWTHVMATNDISANYITLSCAYANVQTAITISNTVGTPASVFGWPVGGFTLSNPIYGGSFSSPSNGETVKINGITITFVNGALTLAGVCNTINAQSSVTNVIATPYANKIQLNSISNSPIYFGTDTGSAASDIGFAASTAYAGAMTYADAVTNEQGFLRWKLAASTIESVCTPIYYNSVVMTGGGVTDGGSVPSTVSWTVGVEHIDQLSTLTVNGEPEGAGSLLTGAAAIKRFIARALTNTITENCNVFNPNIAILGSTVAYNTSQMVIQSVSAAAIDTVADMNTVEGNLTVVQINNV